jgi:hypothetical protein
MYDFDKALKSLSDFYGIERLEDGIAYRILGGTTRLKLLYPIPASETSKLYEYNIEPTIVSLQALKALIEHAPKKPSTPLPIHIWLNVGYRTTGIATPEELHAVMMLMQNSPETVFCHAIGTKFPYEQDISTFSDFYKYTPASIKARILKHNSWHTPCATRFNELVAPHRHESILLHNATSFEVYANEVDPSTSLITVGNLFYYGFKSRIYKWPLELQQLASLPVGHCLSNDCKPLSHPMQIATLFSRIPTATIFSKTNNKNKILLTILEEDLNYGKVVVKIKDIRFTTAYIAERKFF